MATPALMPTADITYPVRLSEQMSSLKQPPRPAINIYRAPYKGYGQCKTATTIVADQGDIVHVVTDVPHKARSEHKVPAVYKGARPMHSSTLRIPMENGTNYETTSQKVRNPMVSGTHNESISQQGRIPMVS